LSFFDEDDEPTRRAPRPRRAAPAGGLDVDPQTLWVRRGIALGAGLLILLALVVLVNACQDSRRKGALRDYNREAAALVTQSDDEVGGQFFQTMDQADSESPEDLQTQVSSLRVQSETLLKQAEKLDTPGGLETAQQGLLISLELRRDGLDYIAQRISTALGNEGDVADQAIEEIGGQMQAFVASDVLIEARVTPVVQNALKDNDVVAEPVKTQSFIKGLSWLDPAYVADQLGTRLSEGGTNRDPNATPAPGLHGTGLQSVKVGGVTLQPDPAANRLPAGTDSTFEVAFQNQGENDEFDVVVQVTLQGQGKAIKARKSVDTVAKGAAATVDIPLPKKPTPGEVYTVTVEVKPVPGEKKTDNNKQTYNVYFTP
jgi:hypothetical protein